MYRLIDCDASYDDTNEYKRINLVGNPNNAPSGIEGGDRSAMLGTPAAASGAFDMVFS